MSRRIRAGALFALALLAAVVAAAIADGYGSSVARSYGPLRQVVVSSRDLPSERPIGPSELAGSLRVRRAPARFVPPGALRAPEEALGLAPSAEIPAGSYLLAAQLRPPGRGGRRGVELRASGGRSRSR